MLRAFIERKRGGKREERRRRRKGPYETSLPIHRERVEQPLVSKNSNKTTILVFCVGTFEQSFSGRMAGDFVFIFFFFFFIFPFLFPLGFVCCFSLACLLKAVHGAVQVAIEFNLLYFILIVIEISSRYYNPYIQNDYIRSIYNIFVISTKYNTFVVNVF